MVNAFELISHPSGISKATKKMFKHSKKSKVKFVRLACHFEEFNETIKVCKILKELGYFVTINLMQISEQSKEKILSVKNYLNKGLTSMPTTLEEELSCNIFLKSKDIETFSKLRDLKDNF